MFCEINRRLCVVCYRISEKPTPKVASHAQECAGCQAAIWVAKKSSTVAPKVCIQCVQSGAVIERALERADRQLRLP